MARHEQKIQCRVWCFAKLERKTPLFVMEDSWKITRVEVEEFFMSSVKDETRLPSTFVSRMGTKNIDKNSATPISIVFDN